MLSILRKPRARDWTEAVANGLHRPGQGTDETMQPQMRVPSPVDQAQAGMAVVDADGAEVGTVTAVQTPGTSVRPDTVAGVAEALMTSGYVRVDGTGHLSNDAYAGGDQIARVTGGDPGEVELLVTWEQLHRATS